MKRFLRFALLFATLVCGLLYARGAEAAHPVKLLWNATAAAEGGYDYSFTMVVSEPGFTGNMDWIIFADVGDPHPADAETLVNPYLTSAPPAPFPNLNNSSGGHAGPTFLHNSGSPSGWQITSVGQTLSWTLHADNLVGDDNLYWSFIIGSGPQAYYERGLKTDHPVLLSWGASEAPAGGYEYSFELFVWSPFAGNVDSIVFADAGSAKPPAAEGMLNPTLVGAAPAPFTTLEAATGVNEGPMFENAPAAGWQVAGPGATLKWRAHADNLVGDLAMYWSSLTGTDPKASYVRAIRGYCFGGDVDGDGVDDPCDFDDDNDGVQDDFDNCLLVPNAGQEDVDSDGQGDACDPDSDNDGVLDPADICPFSFDPGQENTDGDLLGDACDNDDDNDTVDDKTDNCRLDPNTDQANFDKDKAGDACDPDDDEDKVPDEADNCPLFPNSDQADKDEDGVGDACDFDNDNDTVPDAIDNCPTVANGSQANNDGDVAGDACDSDDDNDGVNDAEDDCPLLSNPGQGNFDGDGFGDACDDSDGDGVSDEEELANGSDPTSGDSDGDGVLDGDEIDPAGDADGDGLINALDPDSDNDGVSDGTEQGVDCPPGAPDCVSDGDSGATTTDPLSADSDGAGVKDGIEDANQNGVVDPGETDPSNPNDDVCSQNTDCEGGDTGDFVCDPTTSDCVAALCNPNGGCPSGDGCHQAGVCDPLTGECSYALKPNGATCDDGNENECTVGACFTGTCVSQSALDGTACDGGICLAGFCFGDSQTGSGGAGGDGGNGSGANGSGGNGSGANGSGGDGANGSGGDGANGNGGDGANGSGGDGDGANKSTLSLSGGACSVSGAAASEGGGSGAGAGAAAWLLVGLSLIGYRRRTRRAGGGDHKAA